MAFALENFLFCLELQLGGIIIAWWGMIASAISIIGVIGSLFFGRGHYNSFFPTNFGAGGAVVSGVVAIIILLIYFYFSYQLLLAVQSVSRRVEFFISIIINLTSSLLVGQLGPNVRLSHHSWHFRRAFHHRSVPERRLAAPRNYLRLHVVRCLLSVRSLRWKWNRLIPSMLERSAHSRVFSNPSKCLINIFFSFNFIQ